MSATRQISKIEATLQQFAVMARTHQVLNDIQQNEFDDLILFSLQGEINLENGDAALRDLENRINDIFTQNVKLRDVLFKKDNLEYLMNLRKYEGEGAYYYVTYMAIISFLRDQYRKKASFNEAVAQLEDVIAHRAENYPDDILAKSAQQVLNKCINRQTAVEGQDLKTLIFDTIDLLDYPHADQITSYRNKAHSIKYTYKDHSLAGVMLTLVGVLVICATLAVAAATFGGLAPLSVVGGVLGASLIISGLGMLGVGSLVSGAVILSRKNSLKRSIFRAANCASQVSENEEQSLPMEVVLGR